MWLCTLWNISIALHILTVYNFKCDYGACFVNMVPFFSIGAHQRSRAWTPDIFLFLGIELLFSFFLNHVRFQFPTTPLPTLVMNLLAQKIRSNYIFYTCYHTSCSTKHLHRPKVKHLNEDSSLSDISTPRKGKTGFSGKIRTYLCPCPLTPTP